MKYFRTKDGVYEFKIIRKLNDSIFEVESINDHYLHKEEIIKESDTIDALCDFIVIKYHDMELPLINSLEELFHSLQEQNIPLIYHCKWLKEHYGNKLEYIKLAILTDKGIMGVAEFNDKGEFELL